MRTVLTDHPTVKFAEDVLAGRFVAGPSVRNSCRRFISDLSEGHRRGIRFDVARANHALGFFPHVLRLNGGQFEGVPFNLHPPQAFIVGNLFGFINEVDDCRRFRVAYVEMGKGNGKSPLVGGIGLLGLVGDGEARAEIYAAATKKDQAMILFRDAVAMVDQSKPLQKNIKKSGKDDKVWNLFHPKSNSFFRPISADDGQSGPRPHIGLVDELHEHKTPAVINMLSAGRKFRRQPMIIAITNSGTDKTSVCWEYHEFGQQVAAQTAEDDTLFSYICDLDDKEDPFRDESCWIKANPLLGSVITESYLRAEVKQGRGMPSKESSVRRLNFCQWTESEAPLFEMDTWDACRREFSLDMFRDKEVVVGLDLSSVRDLTASVFTLRTDAGVFWWPEFWIPKEGISKRTDNDKVPYDTWARNGVVRTTPGRTIDKDFVVKDMQKLANSHGFKIRLVVYDRWRIDDFNKACQRVGVSYEMQEFGQGFKDMAPAVDEMEKSMLAGQLFHNGNPCLRWNVANSIATQDAAGNRKLDKEKATGRIDGAVAGIMSHRTSLLLPPYVEPRIRWG